MTICCKHLFPRLTLCITGRGVRYSWNDKKLARRAPVDASVRHRFSGLLFPNRNFHIAVAPPSYLQRNSSIVDVLVAYIFAGAVVDLAETTLVDV
jgi:hypothetical protein